MNLGTLTFGPRGVAGLGTQTLAQWCASPVEGGVNIAGEALTSMILCNPAAKWWYGSSTPPPPPPPPGVSLVGSSQAASDPTAVYAGTAPDGTQVYAIPQTPQQNMDQYRQQLQAYFDSLSSSGGPVDCTSTWNSLFSSECPSPSYSGFIIVAVGVVLAASFLLGKGH